MTSDTEEKLNKKVKDLFWESLRAENERLKDQVKEITAASENDGVNWYDLGYQHGAVSTLNDDLVKEIDEKTLETQVANTSVDLLNSELESLRKRCEDLEAVNKQYQEACDSIYKKKIDLQKFVEVTSKLLSQ